MTRFKKNGSCLIIIFTIILFVGCNYNNSVEQGNDESLNIQANAEITQSLGANNISEEEIKKGTYDTEIENTIPSEINDNKTIKVNNSDFILLDDDDSLELDSKFSANTTNKTEISKSYIGEVYVDEYSYKYYLHEYEGFNLYISNANYELKNRNFDEYYITSIKMTEPIFKTSRGITVGNTKSEVIDKYGISTNTTEDNVLTYRYKDKEIKFEFDENDFIITIVLGVILE